MDEMSCEVAEWEEYEDRGLRRMVDSETLASPGGLLGCIVEICRVRTSRN